MILVFGGTSETAELTLALAHSGHSVLVSTATDVPLDSGDHPQIRRRCGRLDHGAMVELIRQQAICLVVDAGHPYAVELHATVAAAAQQAQVPCFCWQRRPATIVPAAGTFFVADHREAAQRAKKLGGNVLLTTGSRHLVEYLELLQRDQFTLYARILPHPESAIACDRAGLPQHARIVGRGPFSVAENRALIRSKNIAVLISKESGTRGGVAEKINAAQQENCRVIIIQRPKEEAGRCQTFTALAELVAAVKTNLKCKG
ncbi:MAG: precorrin-6A reductase [Desulfuromusa sp.]|nr:precorrin-6A reductase [Desulfuromusa sp.]